MNTALMFSRQTDEWSTPRAFYETLNAEFHFTYDPCPLHATDGLIRPWHGSVFVNPPFSKTREFLEKAHREMQLGNAHTVVFLLPARTDTRWFHELVLDTAEIRFIKGRLKFGNARNAAPFPSMIAIYRQPIAGNK